MQVINYMIAITTAQPDTRQPESNWARVEAVRGNTSNPGSTPEANISAAAAVRISERGPPVVPAGVRGGAQSELDLAIEAREST